jgi:hypothetical protein
MEANRRYHRRVKGPTSEPVLSAAERMPKKLCQQGALAPEVSLKN